jgi:hypothetical protein
VIQHCIGELARLSRQATISADEVRAYGSQLDAITGTLATRAAELLFANGILTRRQLKAALYAASDSELEELLKRVAEEMPNNYEWKPPEEPFCSFCDKRPDWWHGATRDQRQARGYKWVLTDWHDQETELQYNGRAFWCADCEAEAEKHFDEYWGSMSNDTHEPEPSEDEAAYHRRYCLEDEVTKVLGSDWTALDSAGDG